MTNGPSLSAIADAQRQLQDRIIRTPVVRLSADRFAELPAGATVFSKLELFQETGSFKARGALLNLDALTAEQRTRGVTGATAGNHGLALSWAAQKAGVSAKIVMPSFADPMRIAGVRGFGAEVVLKDSMNDLFPEMERLTRDEGRIAVHPFEGELTTLGTATCGAELMEDLPDLDLVIIPVGGGGLISGISAAIKQLRPGCRVIGVEPHGADAMSRSFRSGRPERLEKVETIADSLGAPMTMPYSLSVARKYVDQMVQISDAEMRNAMRRLHKGLGIAAEPACAASLAALLGPCRAMAEDRRVAIIACGSSVSISRFTDLLAEQGQAH